MLDNGLCTKEDIIEVLKENPHHRSRIIPFVYKDLNMIDMMLKTKLDTYNVEDFIDIDFSIYTQDQLSSLIVIICSRFEYYPEMIKFTVDKYVSFGYELSYSLQCSDELWADNLNKVISCKIINDKLMQNWFNSL